MASDKGPLQKPWRSSSNYSGRDANLKHRKILTPMLPPRSDRDPGHAVLRQSLILRSRDFSAVSGVGPLRQALLITAPRHRRVDEEKGAENRLYWIQPPPTTTSWS